MKNHSKCGIIYDMRYTKASKQEILDFLTRAMRNDELSQSERLKACDRLFEYYFKLRCEPETDDIKRVVIVDDIAKVQDLVCQTK